MPSADENSKNSQMSPEEEKRSSREVTEKLAIEALTEASERWNREQARKKKKQQ